MRIGTIIAIVSVLAAVIAGLYFLRTQSQASKLQTKAAGMKAKTEAKKSQSDFKQFVSGWLG